MFRGNILVCYLLLKSIFALWPDLPGREEGRSELEYLFNKKWLKEYAKLGKKNSRPELERSLYKRWLKEYERLDPEIATNLLDRALGHTKRERLLYPELSPQETLLDAVLS